MIQNIERPHFFPGQWIDYRDFNALSDLPEDTLSLFAQKLVENGGLAVTSQHEFEVIPSEGLVVQVRPGVAILPSGRIVALTEDVLVNLEPHRGKWIIASVGMERTGVQPYVDPEDPTIRGFTRQRARAQIQVGEGSLPPDSLELFRVHVPSHARRLRAASQTERWSQEQTLLGRDANEGILDLRHRRLFLPLTHGHLPSAELIRVRTALYEIHRDVQALHQATWVERPLLLETTLVSLHSEILALPIQVHKIGFLAAEFASELARWLETIARKTQRTDVLDLLGTLAAMRSHEVHPRLDVIRHVLTLAPAMRALTQLTEQHYLVTTVLRDALADLRDRALEFGERMSLAGHALTRVDLMSAETRSRISTSHPAVERWVRSSFASGERLAMPGLFVREGTLQTELRIPRVTSPGVLLLRRHVRRPQEHVVVELNGRTLGEFKKSDSSAEDLWVTSGFVVPEADLVAGDNQLRLTVRAADLEFGWFEAAFYQIDGRSHA